MGYNRENFIRIKREFEGKNIQAKEEAIRRMSLLYEKIPELRQIDDALSEIGFKLFNEGLKGKEGFEERAELVRREMKELQRDHANCLKHYGYPEDYTEVRYECKECGDTGYVGLDMCDCMKRALILAGYESSGLGNLMRTQSFETFDINYHKDDGKSYENIKYILEICKEYAYGFNTEKADNLILMGATGLGKTHISTSVAKVIIERGYDVVYDTTQNIFEDFQYERFNRTYQDMSEVRIDKYFDCDLLIMDDLGTEVSNQFTIASLYNIINTRLNNNKSIIINTNLQREELRKRYADRITSRLFGEFKPFVFKGRDVRELKLKR